MLNRGHFNFRIFFFGNVDVDYDWFTVISVIRTAWSWAEQKRGVADRPRKVTAGLGCVKPSEILATSTCSVMQQPLQWCFDSVKELKHSVFYSSNVGTSCRLVLSIQQPMRSATWQELVRSQAVTDRKCLFGKTPSMGRNDVLFCHIITLWKKNNPPFIFFYIIFNWHKHGVHLLHHCAVERLFFYLIGHFKCCFEEYEMRRAGSKGWVQLYGINAQYRAADGRMKRSLNLMKHSNVRWPNERAARCSAVDCMKSTRCLDGSQQGALSPPRPLSLRVGRPHGVKTPPRYSRRGYTGTQRKAQRKANVHIHVPTWGSPQLLFGKLRVWGRRAVWLKLSLHWRLLYHNFQDA